MSQLLKSLRRRHAAIQKRIKEEQARPLSDSIRLQALKRLKLHFREQIEFVEQLNRRGKMRLFQPMRHRSLALACVRPRR